MLSTYIWNIQVWFKPLAVVARFPNDYDYSLPLGPSTFRNAQNQGRPSKPGRKTHRLLGKHPAYQRAEPDRRIKGRADYVLLWTCPGGSF